MPDAGVIWMLSECRVHEHRAALQLRHNERDGVLNHQPHDCLLNRLFKAQIKENMKAPRHWPLWREFTGDHWIPRTKGQWKRAFGIRLLGQYSPPVES